MKKRWLVCALVLAVGIGFGSGYLLRYQNCLQQKQQSYHRMISFATDKLETLQTQYDPDTMEALTSNLYAACQFCTQQPLSQALHELWNALLFEGENCAGMEEELILALQTFDAQAIEDLAAQIRTKNS